MEQNKNMITALDPRAAANLLLDLADEKKIELTNLSLNKLLFFGHADFVLSTGAALVCVDFEAWQFGPVCPAVYHEFKCFGEKPISSRAKKFDPRTGHKIVVETEMADAQKAALIEVIDKYGRLPPGALVRLSHLPGSPWDLVWNGESKDNFGLLIKSNHILISAGVKRSALRQNGDMRAQTYAN